MTYITTPRTGDTSLASTQSPASSSTSNSPPTSGTSQTSKPHNDEPKLPYPSPTVEDISGFPRINPGYIPPEPLEHDSVSDTAASSYPNSASNRSPSPSPSRSEDPFAAQRSGEGTEGNPFRFEARHRSEDEEEDDDEGPRPERACDKSDRTLSGEGDALTTSPRSSRTQRPEGSPMATRENRDSSAEKSHERDGKRHSGLVEKGWARIIGRSSKGEKD
ncbi:hypothetical protein BKA64DRAFT_704432 [Cadophora sp. MPI-SDFR-AT-0126]|nr:hypothetical protein BKA64DRAFT_704432 [Leotiomycetes sp. MPI-SDFR-AT-0126]